MEVPNLDNQNQNIVSEPEPEKDYGNPDAYGIDINKTVGLSTSPTILNHIISMITLPKGEKKVFEFPRIILNFDKEGGSLWWANKQKGIFMQDFGFATDTYFNKFWGNSSIAISATKLLQDLNDLRMFKQIIFWADPKTKIYGVQAGNVDRFSGRLESTEEVTTSLNKGTDKDIKSFKNFPIALDAEYIPIMKESHKENSLIFGAEIEASELKIIMDRGERYSVKFYPFEISKTGITVSFNDMLNPQEGANVRDIIPKLNSLKVPSDDVKIKHVVGSLLEGPQKNLNGEITIRFAAKQAPVYILKKEKNDSGGILVSGYILGTNIDDSKKR